MPWGRAGLAAADSRADLAVMDKKTRMALSGKAASSLKPRTGKAAGNPPRVMHLVLAGRRLMAPRTMTFNEAVKQAMPRPQVRKLLVGRHPMRPLAKNPMVKPRPASLPAGNSRAVRSSRVKPRPANSLLLATTTPDRRLRETTARGSQAAQALKTARPAKTAHLGARTVHPVHLVAKTHPKGRAAHPAHQEAWAHPAARAVAAFSAARPAPSSWS